MTKDNILFSPATNQDFNAIYGYNPPHEVFAWIAKRGSDILGIAGVFITPERDNLFLDIVNKDLTRNDKFKIAKQIKIMLNLFSKETDLNLCLERDLHYKGSRHFVEKLGFQLDYKTKNQQEVWRYGS